MALKEGKEKSQLELLLEELGRLASVSPPDDWIYQDPEWGEYNEYGKYGEVPYVREPDESNKGDIHNHGMAVGAWTIAQILRRLQVRYAVKETPNPPTPTPLSNSGAMPTETGNSI